MGRCEERQVRMQIFFYIAGHGITDPTSESAKAPMYLNEGM
jgi:hypothetical protein